MRQTLLGKLYAEQSQVSGRSHAGLFLEFGFEVGERVPGNAGKLLKRRFFHKMVAHILDTGAYMLIDGRLVRDRRHIFETEEKAAEELDAGTDRFLFKTGKESESCPQQLNMRASKLEPVFTERGQFFLYIGEDIVKLETVFPVQAEKALRVCYVDLQRVELIGFHEAIFVAVELPRICDGRLISRDDVGLQIVPVHDLEDTSSMEHAVEFKDVRVVMHGCRVCGTAEIPVGKIGQARNIMFVFGDYLILFCP